MKEQIMRDLGRKLQHDLAGVLEREMRIAAVVLDPFEVTSLMVDAAVMMVRTVAASTTTQGADAATVELIYDHVVAEILRRVTESRPDSIVRALAARKAPAA